MLLVFKWAHLSSSDLLQVQQVPPSGLVNITHAQTQLAATAHMTK
jgi:hypothetical protein